MNLHIEGTRPPSARPQSRINPITGEEMPHSARGISRPTQPVGVTATTTNKPAAKAQSHFGPSHRPESRPQGVPRLYLGKLANDDDDPDLTLFMDPYSYKLDTPGSASTISWGPATPTSVSQQNRLEQFENETRRSSHRSARPVAPHQHPQSAKAPATIKQPTAWDRDPVPENIQPPSQRQKDQYAQRQKEIRDSYRERSDRGISESEIERKIEELRLEVPQYAPPEDDDDKDQLQKDWTTEPYSKASRIKRSDKETLEEENRKKKLLETVMIDQLSRPVISCPDQNLSHRSQSHRPGIQKGSVRAMYDSSRIASAGTATENLLSRRVQFGARVLTRVGRDAIRELTGFFFAADNSLTIYEFKQFGKTAKALPFIKRGVYTHLTGARRGQPYTLADLKQGESLLFETKDQPLPDSMKLKDIGVFKIAHVDDEAKATILFNGVPPAEQDNVWKRAHIPQTKEEINARLLQMQVQECIRSQIRKRGLKVYTGLYKLFNRLDEEGTGCLNRVELDKALIDFHIEVPQENFEDLWELVDIECTSFMEYDVFVRGYFGQMSENRKALVRKAFSKIDSNRKGDITCDDVKKFYNAHKHPKVRSGECSEDDIVQNFLSHFAYTATPKVITFYEFENYYEGLSVCVESDDDFNKILQNAWSI